MGVGRGAWGVEDDIRVHAMVFESVWAVLASVGPCPCHGRKGLRLPAPKSQTFPNDGTELCFPSLISLTWWLFRRLTKLLPGSNCLTFLVQFRAYLSGPMWPAPWQYNGCLLDGIAILITIQKIIKPFTLYRVWDKLMTRFVYPSISHLQRWMQYQHLKDHDDWLGKGTE